MGAEVTRVSPAKEEMPTGRGRRWERRAVSSPEEEEREMGAYHVRFPNDQRRD